MKPPYHVLRKIRRMKEYQQLMNDTAHTLQPTQMVQSVNRTWQRPHVILKTLINPELFGYVTAPLYAVLSKMCYPFCFFALRVRLILFFDANLVQYIIQRLNRFPVNYSAVDQILPMLLEERFDFLRIFAVDWFFLND